MENPKILFLLGCDNNISAKDIPKDAFVVYIGSFGDQGAQYADIILPAAAYTETNGTYGIFIYYIYSKYLRESTVSSEGNKSTRAFKKCLGNI